jgi:ribosomal protein S18 acetylase RimI-like enzyme
MTLYPCQTESDFKQICAIESEIAKAINPTQYAPQPCNLVFDRYLFGSSDKEIFTYGKLLKQGGQAIGYALCYLAFPGESEYTVRLLPEHEEHLHEAIECIEAAFADKSEYSMIVNELDVALQQALEKCGYAQKEARRWLGWFDLTRYTPQDIGWINETISPLREADIDDRVRYGDIPTGHAITRPQYEAVMNSEYYGDALDYVVHDNATNAFAGFVTWWIDDNSKTAVLEPVACLPEYRRRGIMKRALWYGLNVLKAKSVRHAFVSTSIHNEKSQPLYLSVGFKNIGTAYRYVKKANS